MANEETKELNRSSAFTPEQFAMVTAMVTAAMKETAAMIASSQTKTNQDLVAALIESRKPYIDPDVERRKVRDQIKFKKDEKEQIERQLKIQENCNHRDDTDKDALNIIHNYPDRQVRGICVRCHAVIHPMEWRIAASPEEAVKMYNLYWDDVPRTIKRPLNGVIGDAYMVPEHPLYSRVRNIAQRTA